MGIRTITPSHLVPDSSPDSGTGATAHPVVWHQRNAPRSHSPTNGCYKIRPRGPLAQPSVLLLPWDLVRHTCSLPSRPHAIQTDGECESRVTCTDASARRAPCSQQYFPSAGERRCKMQLRTWHQSHAPGSVDDRKALGCTGWWWWRRMVNVTAPDPSLRAHRCRA